MAFRPETIGYSGSNVLDGKGQCSYSMSTSLEFIVTAVLYKVYCYRGTDKQIWFEVEDRATGQGVAWSPSLATVVKKAKKLGYAMHDECKPVIKFYRAQAS